MPQMPSVAGMSDLFDLQLGSQEPVDWQTVLRGATQLETLVVHANHNLNADLVSAIRPLSELQSVVIGGDQGCKKAPLFYAAEIAKLMRSRGRCVGWTTYLG